VSTSNRQAHTPRGGLRHPAEVPFFIFMVVLNVLIILAIIQAAITLPFLPERIQDSGWGVAIRSALVGLLLLIPALIVIRETQRASVRASAVQLSRRQYGNLYRTADEFARRLGLRRRPQIYPGQRQRNAERVRGPGHRPRLRRAGERVVRESAPGKP
jgi:hypothetical protein